MTGNHAQRGSLATAGWPQKATIAARRDLEVDRIDRGYAAVPLRQLHQFQSCRGRHPHHFRTVLLRTRATLTPGTLSGIECNRCAKNCDTRDKKWAIPLFDAVDGAAPTQI